VNVRCPHCSAVFPAGTVPDGGDKTVECPLCLLRFAANAEVTVSVAPASPPPQPAASDDGFERFGGTARPTAPIRSGQTVSISTARGATAPRPSAPPAAADDEIDFDSLLSDAIGAVEKHEASAAAAPPATGRTNPFARIAAPRQGGGATARTGLESVFGPEASASHSSTGISQAAAAPTQVLSDAASPFQPYSNTSAASDFLAGFGTGGAVPGALPSPPSVAAHTDDDSLFESGGPRRSVDDDPPDRPNPVRRGPAPVAAAAGAKGKAKRPAITFDRLLAAAMIAAAAGVATDYLGLGLFAIKLWGPPPPAAVKVERPVPKDIASPVALDDTRAAYELELARLDKVLQIRPDDAGLKARRIAIYFDLLERYPEALDEDGETKAGFERLQKAGTLAGPRFTALDALRRGDFALAAGQWDALKGGSVDDRAAAARARLADFAARLERQALDTPGLTSGPDIDPLRVSGAEDPALAEASAMLDAAVVEAAGAPNRKKLEMLQAELADRMGRAGIAGKLIQPIVAAAPGHLDAQLLLASAELDQGRLDEAQKAIDHVTLALAGDVKAPRVPRALALVKARLAARRGDRESQIEALAEHVAAHPADELSTVRGVRLQLADKKLDDAHKLISAGKKDQRFKSVAFVVVVVEYWLTVNRNEDALAELREVAKLYPGSLELLYLRGQVEDKQAHYATARDYFAQVLQREPRHLRASVRLAELQMAAGRHDEALATLERAREHVGDEETLLRLVAEELDALKRPDEARATLDKLLTMAPDNRRYLLRAAQMDLKSGKADRALEFLRKLRNQKALDRTAAVQLALALSERKASLEAASAVAPFADEAQNDVELASLAGRLFLDAGEVDKAAVHIQRAVQVSNAKSAEAMFQYGRLAFKRGDVGQGTSRIRQAITQDPLAHAYRFELGRALLEVKGDADARKVAVDELETIERTAESFASAGRPVGYLADVHRLLARAFLDSNVYGRAIRHLRAVIDAAPDDVDARADLGRAQFFASDPECGKTLRDVLGRRPGDARSALYFGLFLLGRHQSSDALPWLQQAAQSGDRRAAEAWYHIALIHRERDQVPQAMKAIEAYLERASRDDTYRADAESMRRSLLGASERKKGR